MQTLSSFKKEMLQYARTVVDLDVGETPKEWVDAYIEALKEDGKIVTVNGKQFVKE